MAKKQTCKIIITILDEDIQDVNPFFLQSSLEVQVYIRTFTIKHTLYESKGIN